MLNSENKLSHVAKTGRQYPSRIIIENVSPEIDGGIFPIKRVVGEDVVVEADVFLYGQDQVRAQLLSRKKGSSAWQIIPMQCLGNDRFSAMFSIDSLTSYVYTVQGWVDYFWTWQKVIQKKYESGQNISVEYEIGAQLIDQAATRAVGKNAKRLKELSRLLRKQTIARTIELTKNLELSSLMAEYIDRDRIVTYPKELEVMVEQPKANFSAWYELFPRSASPDSKRSGTFEDCIDLLPEIAEMGFDVLYLPPIHPIGQVNRKGKNNSEISSFEDPGCPWAIGAKEGGHTSILPELGTLEDFKKLVKQAKKHNIDMAIDIAFQCAPDHPYLEQHKKWFRTRPDGTIQYAENPPKKYQDVIPFDFENSEWEKLWEELKNIVLYWAKQGIRIFRVDNPHTKPFLFWDLIIAQVKKEYPEAIFLSEAFTRPKVMNRLAKGGFSQSYTYFTWRNTKQEITQYMQSMLKSNVKEYLRPNFWPNTPDILPEYLQYGGRPGFIIRFILAATLSSNYGIYGPVFELCMGEALSGKEEYKDSEKYEIKHWNRDLEGNIKDIIKRVNAIRKDNKALQSTWNINFYTIDNDSILFYSKVSADLSSIIFVAVNLDPYHKQSGWVNIPLKELGLDSEQPYLVHDLISDDNYIWQGVRSYIELDPFSIPAHIFKVKKTMRKEADFDYFF
ncbi:MAG: alpha-1,4-glucan--maltose-1-phosphate maltosyltransferase [Candidatus Omnitrophica bacterium]|nr:alpha-1,4-glucan--maltose-1-phosphate maltosyltransferase [Candidatus Omnitrophota bacterium]